MLVSCHVLISTATLLVGFIRVGPRGGGLRYTFREIPAFGRARGRTPSAKCETPDRWRVIVFQFPELHLSCWRTRRWRQRCAGQDAKRDSPEESFRPKPSPHHI